MRIPSQRRWESRQSPAAGSPRGLSNTAGPFRKKAIPEIEGVRQRFERRCDITARSVFSRRRRDKYTKEHTELLDRLPAF